MFYSYADKQGDGFFGGWQLRQVAFDTTRRYLYYSEPTKSEVPLVSDPAPASEGGDSGSATATASAPSGSPQLPGSPPARDAAYSPAKLLWKKKIKVTAVVPLATRAHYVQRSANEKDLYQLEIKGESRPMATGEYPPAGPLLCAAAGLSNVERARCSPNNEAYIRDPFFLKELFDALRDQFDEMAKARVRAAAAAAEGGVADEPGLDVVDGGTQTLVSPRRHKTDGAGASDARLPVRVVLRCRDEREFRRLWYVLQTVLGYDKLIVRPYRGLPPYDPRNGVAFAHIPMAVWHTFQSLDKAVFYTFIRGCFYALEASGGAEAPSPRTSSHGSEGRAVFGPPPQLRRVVDSAYLCITHDSVLCMRESGNIPRWLRLAEVQEFHWNVTSKEAKTNKAAPFCVFLSDAPIPDLFFEPTAPAYGTDAIASYNPLVDIRRVARVVHDTCFASFSTRRVIRIKEVQDESMAAYVARTAREGGRPPALQIGSDYNSTLSCPLPKEQLAVVWQQVQSELLERGNMANRAAIPIYPSNARDVELNEDQLSTVERELDGERERRDDVVGMPLERARQVERRRRTAAAAATAQRPRERHRDVRGGESRGSVQSSSPTEGSPNTTATGTQVMPLTMELLQTPQLQGRFATTVAQLQGEGRSSSRSSRSESTMAASEYSSYLVPGTRYITQEEWQSGGYAAPASPPASATAVAATATSATTATAAPSRPPAAATASGGGGGGGGGGRPAPSQVLEAPSRRSSDASTSAADLRGDVGGKPTKSQLGKNSTTAGPSRRGYGEERTINEIVGHSMAALDGSRADLDQMDRK